MQNFKSIRKLLLAAALTATAGAGLATPASAQVPGLLPSIHDVEPQAPTPIDGMWRIRELDKRIMIENGYGYAIDSWIHMLVFEIQPDQVVLQNFDMLPDGSIVADDLPLMSKVVFTPQPDGSLKGTTQALIPVTYHLDPAGYDYGYDDGGDEEDYWREGPMPYPPEPEVDGPWDPDGPPPENPDAGEEPVSPWG